MKAPLKACSICGREFEPRDPRQVTCSIACRAARKKKTDCRSVPAIPSRTPGARVEVEVRNGTVLVASDAHYWPEVPTVAHLAFLAMCGRLKPSMVILNGDILDGARISRYDAGQWVDYSSRPTVTDELAACQARLREIAAATPGVPRFWTLGNHDARFEGALLKASPEYAGVRGTRLKDHFEDWVPAMSIWINHSGPHPVVVKHRFKGGIYAPRNNALLSGLTTITGHLHSLKVMPHTDYRGTRWGVDCGTLAAPYTRKFLYIEDNPVDWRSGFVVLTFIAGRLLWPEIVYVVDEEAGLWSWRGEVHGPG